MTTWPLGDRIKRNEDPLLLTGRALFGMSFDQTPWLETHQCIHVELFPHGVFHAENVGEVWL